ncbi:Universal stress protein Rv2005c/MT2061 [Nocardia otitidiscaviarum]|uniref:Universal stress protein Rv2005c/MT2061 n=1 Tax=Nocardia otitidiscaviarum TaxID=1823 RepID=A0A379JMY8_9NOCA|nr:universal stress protein [Nocardia otitidiscaviarum]SUD49373.1 Universal stress protein Rv2005c/MT2061 [Nocardia otitidiscaviarum]
MTDNSETPGGELNPPVIAAVDGSAVSYHAAAWAAVDAALHGCPLHLVTSVSVPTAFGPGAQLTESDTRWLHEDGERVVAEAKRIARNAAPGEALDITTEVTLHPVIPDLIDRSQRARTLVVGTRGLGAFRRGLLGSVSTAVTRHAHCPVAVIPGPAVDPISAEKPVLVGVDGTPVGDPALAFAFEEASRRKVGLTALHAWSDYTGPNLPAPGWDMVRDQEEALLAERLAGYGERYPDVPVRRILVMDRPVRALLDESENAQLVVVGSHGRGGFTGMLLGSTSSALLHSVDCPAVVVRSR